MFKILHTIRSVDPRGGGPIEGVRNQAAVWFEFGCHVEVASLDAPTDDWVKEFPTPLYPLGPSVGKYGLSLRFVQWLRLHAAEYDVVVVNGIWSFNSFGTWLALGGRSVPFVVFTHGMLGPWFKTRYPLKHLKKWLYWPWAEYFVLAHAAAVLFTTEEEMLSARKSFWLYKAKEIVVRYGTSAPPDVGEPGRQAFFARFPHLQNKRIILFVGRIAEVKGCDLLIRAFAQVFQDTQWHLVIGGPDPHGLTKPLKVVVQQCGITDRVTWAGMLSGIVKWGAFRSSDAFVLPSHHENFGVVVAEALGCGLPVLISDKVNIWREVESAGAGFVASDTLQGTCEVMRKWLALSDESRDSMREAALSCFVTNFEIHGSINNLVRVFRDLGARKGGEVGCGR